MARKCLVLDLDNTLWGGVVGDDGMHGLVLGQGDAVGEAFLAVQRAAGWLHSRGVLLAVCSKNDDAVARAAFRDHPDMLLRLEDIAVFQANWHDKATNLRAIATALSIGPAALVLLDDNPAERALVRSELPEVAVPELPADPAGYPAVLLAAGYFEALGFTTEDRARAGHYRADAQRAALATSCVDMDAYLQSLEMTIHFAPFDVVGRARIAQLTNRSNQFNLTTRRRDEAALSALESRADAFTLQIRLADRFGDNGMIGVVICTAAGTDWVIDTWLMSCRVLNRRVEEAVLDVLATSGVHIGGTDFDQKLSLEQVMPLLGYRHLGPQGREVPSRIFFDLSTWHLINWLYQPRALSDAQALWTNYTDARLHQRLMHVLKHRLGHRIAYEVEQAKIRCSQQDGDTVLDLSEVEANLAAPMGMADMREHLQALLARTVACARECVQKAGLTIGALDAIYLTGGSSALRPFQRALQAEFAGVPLVEGDLFGGVASGLAYSRP
jgi:FkbH-like protein